MFQGELWRVLETQIIAPGNWRAFVQAKLRNIIKGTKTEHRFSADEEIERAVLDQRPVEFLYQDGGNYFFMDTSNYEQIALNSDILAGAIKFLTSNMKLMIEMYEEKPIGIVPPPTVHMKVMETPPFIKTATATNVYKPATLETGAIVSVPGFISEGEMIEIDTSTGEYLGRAK